MTKTKEKKGYDWLHDWLFFSISDDQKNNPQEIIAFMKHIYIYYTPNTCSHKQQAEVMFNYGSVENIENGRHK